MCGSSLARKDLLNNDTFLGSVVATTYETISEIGGSTIPYMLVCMHRESQVEC